MSEYFDLGGYGRQVTGSARARTWFNRGLVWGYAFNHEEAAACFERAAEADPGCAMAYWGLAYAVGPNYNKPWEAFGPGEAPAAISRALSALGDATGPARSAAPVERALLRAMAARYPAAAPASDGAWDPAAGAAHNAGYAAAMREVYRSHPGDLDVAALFADALMNLTPWALWDIATGEPGRGNGHPGGQGRAGAGPGRPGRPGAPRHPAYVHTPDGDVRPAAGRTARR